MARFVVGQPVTTPEPRVVVDAGLRAGEHRFQLVVVTADGRVSAPEAAIVRIVESQPTPIGPPGPVGPG